MLLLLFPPALKLLVKLSENGQVIGGNGLSANLSPMMLSPIRQVRMQTLNSQALFFFVAGTTGGTATRSFKVPSSKYLLLPLVNVSLSELDAPGLNDQERIALTTDAVDQVDSLVAVIDGVPIENPFDFRETTPSFFSYEAVENNAFGTTRQAWQRKLLLMATM